MNINPQRPSYLGAWIPSAIKGREVRTLAILSAGVLSPVKIQIKYMRLMPERVIAVNNLEYSKESLFSLPLTQQRIGLKQAGLCSQTLLVKQSGILSQKTLVKDLLLSEGDSHLLHCKPVACSNRQILTC